MPRPRIIALGAAAGIALAAVLGTALLRHTPQTPSPVQEPDTTANTPLGPRPVKAPNKPSPPAQPAPSAVVSAQSKRAQRSDAGVVLDAAVVLDEAQLMAQLRALAGTNSPLTLQLAREGNIRFPDSPDAPERAWMVVKSLANLERFKDAHDEAAIMVKRYPGTSWSLDVQRHLLSNPLE